MFADQEARFGYDQWRHDERVAGSGEPPYAVTVVGIAAVGEGVQNACVDNDHRRNLPAEPVLEQFISAFGHVAATAVTDADEGGQATTA
jgi:hypothetical protein